MGLIQKFPTVVARSRATRRQLVRSFQRITNATLSLVFPPCCANCEESLDVESIEPQFCQKCLVETFTPKKMGCPRCGIPGQDADTCSECQGRKFAFDRAVALGAYQGELQLAVLRMKNESGQPLAMAAGKRLGDLLDCTDDDGQADLITCIPKYWLKRLRTGVNSAETIMFGVGRTVKIQVVPDLLICRRRISKQSMLTPNQRRRNVDAAWKLNPDFDIHDRHIVVVDDTMTTGATAHEAAKCLKKAGAKRVTVAVIARAEKTR